MSLKLNEWNKKIYDDAGEKDAEILWEKVHVLAWHWICNVGGYYSHL